MKRKVIPVVLLICVSAALASCVSIPYDKPYGVWQNETVGLTLDIDPIVERQRPCSGVYIIDGEETEVEIVFGHYKDFKIENVGEDGEETFWDGSKYVVVEVRANLVHIYFGGDFKVKDGKLYYTLWERYQELTGIKDTIIFDLIKAYEA